MKIREIKKQARLIVSKNYKSFIFPVVLIIFSNLVTGISLYAFSNKADLFKTNSAFGYLFLGLYIAFRLVVYPISIFLLVKASVRIVTQDIHKNNNSALPFSFKDAVNVTLIWLIPNLLTVSYSVLDGIEYYTELPIEQVFVVLLAALVLLAILVYLEYKFFACNYYYSLHRGKVKDTIGFSFKLMKGKVLKYILLTLSFVHWHLLIVLLVMIVTKVFSMGEIPRLLLQPLGFGICFYLLPYEHAAYTIFIKNSLTK